jgi:hypothetical protein
MDMISNLKIDMHNTTDPTEPFLLSRHTDPAKWSSSGAEWDENSLRCVPFDNESSFLVFPVNKRVPVNRTTVDDVKMEVFSHNRTIGIPIDSPANAIDRAGRRDSMCFWVLRLHCQLHMGHLSRRRCRLVHLIATDMPKIGRL